MTQEGRSLKLLNLLCAPVLFSLISWTSIWAAAPHIVDFDFGGHHGCVVFDDGKLKCLGANFAGQLGLGDDSTRGDEPLEMGSDLPYVYLGMDFKVVSVQAGYYHTCATSSEGRIKCWGENYHGQLGTQDLLNLGDEAFETGNEIPYLDFSSEIQTEGPLLKFVTGSNHNCALFTSGRVKCFGTNQYGELGLEVNDPYVMKHKASFVNISRKISNIFASSYRTCLLDEMNKLLCFGRNFAGSLGQGSDQPIGRALGDISNLQPIRLGTDAKIVDVSGEFSHTCVSFEKELPKCFGYGEEGILGIGNTEYIGESPEQMGDSLLPVQFPNLPPLKVSGGFNFNCGLDADVGKVYCWGVGKRGSLGTGFETSIGGLPEDIQTPLAPVSLGDNEFVVKIKSGISSSCVLLKGSVDFKDQKIKCWGGNSFGGLGQGHTLNLGDEPQEMGEYLHYLEF